LTDNPRFTLELRFSATGTGFEVQEPTILTDSIMDQAYSLLDSFLMGVADEVIPDITDEQYRELFIELCYKLVYREMCTLRLLPDWEERFKEDLGTRRRGVKSPGGRYGS
jgi:hypothetical protein